MISIVRNAKISFSYVNYRGHKEDRIVMVDEIYWGSTEWHPEPQWLMTALDYSRNAIRDFAMKDMSNVKRA